MERSEEMIPSIRRRTTELYSPVSLPKTMLQNSLFDLYGFVQDARLKKDEERSDVRRVRSEETDLIPIQLFGSFEV